MQDDAEEQRRVFRWALPGSVGAHLLIAVILIFGLPLPQLASQEEKAIAVDLVPPEPQKKPEAKPPKPAKPPEPPPRKKTAPPPVDDDAAARQAMPVLKPVVRFGDKDAGPRESRDGDGAEEGATRGQQPAEPDKGEVAQPPALATDGQKEQAPLTPEPKAPTPKPQDALRREAQKPESAKKLLSQKATGDAIATTAMGDLPRGVRAGRLCVTELREQLNSALPPYFPDLLPSYRLGEGNVIDAQRAAFRMNGEWYDLSYRCEVDANATRVVAFDFRVGDPLPASEWRSRGLPGG